MLRYGLAGVVMALAVGCGSTDQVQQGLGSTEPGQVEAPVCRPTTTDLFILPSEEVGTVTVTSLKRWLTVEVRTTAPWWLQRVNVYVGAGPMPTNRDGVPAPALFPHRSDFVLYQSAYSVTFEVAELGVACGEPLTVAVNAEVVRLVEGEPETDAIAWAWGVPFDAHGSGWSFEHERCCTPPTAGCTRSQGYWKTHHAGARVPALDRDWPLPEATELCGRGWLELLGTAPRGGDAWVILAHQYIAARLNVAAGASVPGEVDDALTDAAAYLSACEVERDDRVAALDVAERLEAYNTGEVGPGHCE